MSENARKLQRELDVHCDLLALDLFELYELEQEKMHLHTRLDHVTTRIQELKQIIEHREDAVDSLYEEMPLTQASPPVSSDDTEIEYLTQPASYQSHE